MKNLLGRLMSRPFDELKQIANTWGTFTREPSPTQNDLAIAAFHTMTDRSAVRAVWESFDPEMRAFVAWLLDQRNMLALVDDLPAHLDRPPEEVSPLLERTRRSGIVDVDEVLVRGTRVVSSGDNLYSWANRNQKEAVRRKVVSIASEAAKPLREVIEEARRPAPFDEPFSELLESLEQEEVQRIAATWRLPDANRYYKSELIGVMSEFLATGKGRETLLASLPQPSRELFDFIESSQAKATAAQVKSHFGWSERELRIAALPLMQRALVWDAISDDRRYLFIPSDLRGGAQKSSTKIMPLMQPKLDAPAPHAIESHLPYEMAWDMLTLLASASRQELSLTLQDERITKRQAKKINEAFIQPADVKAETDYIDILVHLARSLGLIAEKGGEQPALVTTPKVDEWAKLSFEAQRHRLHALWQEDRKWSEPATYGTIYWWNSDLTNARKRITAHLMELTPMQWVSLDGFLRKIHLNEPFIIWSQDELVRRFGLRALQGFRSQWFEIEGRIVADMLRTMLSWLGVVDLGRDKQKRFVSFRITESAHALLDPTYRPDAVQPPSKTLLVQPNFEVLVLHPESRVVWSLIRMADLVRHDRVSVYALNRESVLRAMEAGLSPTAIKEFLNANTGKGLPQNVAHSIDDWGRSARRVELSQATLIEVEDASVLDELLASRKTRKHVLRRLSPTAAIANLPAADGPRDDPLQKLLKELRGAGYFPSLLVSTEPDASDTATPVSTPKPALRVASQTIQTTKGHPKSKIQNPKTGTR